VVGRIIRDPPIQPLNRSGLNRSIGRSRPSALPQTTTPVGTTILGRPSSFLNGKERKLSEAASEMPPLPIFHLKTKRAGSFPPPARCKRNLKTIYYNCSPLILRNIFPPLEDTLAVLCWTLTPFTVLGLPTATSVTPLVPQSAEPVAKLALA